MASSPPHPSNGDPHQVDVWCFDLDREAAVTATLLSLEERDRAGRFLRPELRERYAQVRTRLRNLLGDALGLNPASIPLIEGPHGKPCIDPGYGLPDLRFNLSHAANRAAFALAWGRDVGIDLEPISSDRDLDGIAERWFTPREAVLLRDLPVDARGREFFRLWTRKEAVLKADGTGIAGGLEHLELGPGRDGFDFVGRLQGKDWLGMDLDLGPGWAGAVAATGEDWQVRWHPSGG